MSDIELNTICRDSDDESGRRKEFVTPREIAEQEQQRLTISSPMTSSVAHHQRQGKGHGFLSRLLFVLSI